MKYRCHILKVVNLYVHISWYIHWLVHTVIKKSKNVFFLQRAKTKTVAKYFSSSTHVYKDFTIYVKGSSNLNDIPAFKKKKLK